MAAMPWVALARAVRMVETYSYSLVLAAAAAALAELVVTAAL
jgi:hypothetical protein